MARTFSNRLKEHTNISRASLKLLWSKKNNLFLFKMPFKVTSNRVSLVPEVFKFLFKN